MKFLDYLTGAMIVIIAITFTALSSLVLPKNTFNPNRLELDSTWHKESDEQAYMINILNTSEPEIVVHHNINKSGNSIEYWHNNTLHQIYIFKENEYLISRFLYFSTIDQDDTKEVVFITAQDNKAYLQILRFDPAINLLKLLPKVEIDSISYFNGKPDVVNNSITSYQSEIYFDLTAGYSIQPRKIYKYNFSNNSIIKTDLNSFSICKIDHKIFNGQGLILAKEIVATSNTAAHRELELLKNSKDPDTLKMYATIKHLEYEYGDFSSYILLYTSCLNFAFKPIEFFGWTNFTKSEFINMDGIPHIIALTNTIKGDSTSKFITLCDLQGSIVKQITIPHNYTDIFTGSGRTVFKDKNTLYRYSNKLEMIREISGITHCEGFFDINGDQENEIIAFRDNEMIVLSPDFDILATFKISQEFAPYPENNGIHLLQIGDRQGFIFNTRLFYYLFSYSHNPLAVFKYPFYILTFAFWIGLIWLILRLNSRRLKKEKLHLEKIVLERTLELQSKNRDLAAQKIEIQTQTDKITEQYKRLEKLDQFKESLTHALVHDLKNPLSQVIINTSNPNVRHAAGKMLRLVSNMLDIEKYETAEFDLNKEQHSLREIVEDVKNGQEMSLKEKNLKVNLLFDDYLIMVDKEIIMRVFDNLLANAIRFSPLNSNIEFLANKSVDNSINISIKNQGEPVSDGALPYIFDKYKHFGKTDSSSYRSTGLGLTFCKMAIEAHGQKIRVQNVEDGVVFSFSLQGSVSAPQALEKENNNPGITLTEKEKKLLKPYFSHLENMDVNQVSDILQVLDEISETSTNISGIKNQIRDAAFAANAGLFRQILHR